MILFSVQGLFSIKLRFVNQGHMHQTGEVDAALVRVSGGKARDAIMRLSAKQFDIHDADVAAIHFHDLTNMGGVLLLDCGDVVRCFH